jgi:hypothetical protein
MRYLLFCSLLICGCDSVILKVNVRRGDDCVSISHDGNRLSVTLDNTRDNW